MRSFGTIIYLKTEYENKIYYNVTVVPVFHHGNNGAEREATDRQTYRTPTGTYGSQAMGSQEVYADKRLSRSQLSILAHLGVAPQLPQDRPSTVERYRSANLAHGYGTGHATNGRSL
ncbi:hypothetical protein [Sphingobacterium hotanense]|uniref:hypothetical protein n=1 Tax=Sphingobacterium hotanense TaxID=649196 RepID=UPI0021A3A11B|nr:hypothetical protein [Sphingobacterium hotanense]MCT1525670.1 hypothetical protein [Sphingobacterium hotanense]